MEIDNLFGKITSNSDKIGMAVGAYSTLASLGKQWGMDAFSAGVNIFTMLLQNPHFPNLQHVWQQMNYQGTFKAAAAAAIGGYLLKEVDLMPQLTKLGNILMKAGIGAAEANAVIVLLTGAGAMNSPFTVNIGRGGSGHGTSWGGN